MATLGSLIISLEANTAAFNSAMDKSAYMAQQSAKRIQGSIDGITSTLKGLVIAAVSIESINRIWEGFKGIYDAEKGLEKMAIRLGTTSSELSALQYAGKKAGMDVDVFNTSIQRMEKNISAAAVPAKNTSGLMGEMGEETAKGSEAFRNLGINAAVLKTLPLKDQLLAISERLKLIPNETDKVRIALDIFGKGGGGMVVMLKAGEQAIDDWIARGRELGVVLDDSMVKRGADASKSISEMKDAFKGFALTLADTVSPTVKEVTGAFTDKLVAIRAADPGLQNLTRTVKEFGAAWAEPTLNALKNGIIGGRIAGLQGAAIGAAAGFAGLTISLRELADALQNPAVLAFLGGAVGSRLGVLGGLAGAAAGGVTGIALKFKSESARVRKEQEAEFSGYETPMGDFAPGVKADIEYKKKLKEYQGLFTDQSFGSPKGGGKGKGAKEVATTVVTEFEKAEWLADDIEKALTSCTTRLDQMQSNTERLVSSQVSYANEMAGLSPLLEDQLKWKESAIEKDEQLKLLTLDRELYEKKISQAVYDQERGMIALTTQAKKFNLEREKWEKEGISGGLKGWAYERKQEGETAWSKQTKGAMKSLESGISSTISKGITGALKGEKTDFMQIGWDIADCFISKTVELGVSQLFTMIAQAVLPMATTTTLASTELIAAGLTVATEIETGAAMAGATLIASATEAAAIMAAANSMSFGFFHSGGVIRAHGGLNLASDEVPIIAQTGERVLSRSQNRAFEAGLQMGGGGHTYNISYSPNYDRRPTGYERRRDIREMNKALVSEMGRRN